MLVLRIDLGIICILEVICAIIAKERNNKSLFKLFKWASIISSITFTTWSILEILNNPTSWIDLGITIAFIVLLYLIVVGYYYMKNNTYDHPFGNALLQAFLILAVLYLLFCFVSCANFVDAFEECNTNHITTSTIKLISATDTTTVNGIISGGGCIVWHISGSVSETPVYRYYYQLDDGGLKLGEIPASSTTIYYIEDGKIPYIEVVTSTKCDGYNPEADSHLLSDSTTTYKLYVPEGSILEVFQFDGS